MPVLEVRDLQVSYGRAVAVHGIDFSLDEGELTALVGPNGAGKSSTLKALSRMVPSDGSVLLDGEPLPRSPVAVVRAGMIHCPEGRHLFPDLTVRDNLLLGAHRRLREPIEDDLEWVLELFPVLSERMDQLAGTMSGGEQQQVALGRSLMARPRVLLLDEPSLGLASIVKETIVDSVLALSDKGITTLLVEQDVAFAFKCADWVLVLEGGVITHRGTPEEVRAHPEIRKAYLGVA